MTAAIVKRFWCPRGATYSLDAEGFLQDPESDWRAADSANSSVVSTECLAEHRCLILLGEPGMGKSTILANPSQLVIEDMPIARFNLNEYGFEDRFVREVFDDPRIVTWSEGGGDLCLVLDSLDEAQARIPNIGAIISSRVGKLPCKRLVLRIACRTADWTKALEESLEDIFGTVSVMEILPLRRIDVADVLGDTCDAQDLLEAVEQARLGPLASRPLTLLFLARTFGQSGSLPGNSAELYDKGILALCEEHGSSYRGSQLVGKFYPHERMAVARRIAATTVFGDAHSLWTGVQAGAGTDDITLEHFVGSSEPTPSGKVSVTREVVWETVKTGLFTSRGSERLGWAHATFADFLAAQWVVTNNLTEEQARPLFLSPDGHCWPQTRLAAAWAVAIAPERFKFVVESDPTAFQGEVELPNDELRAAVVDGLFSRASDLSATLWQHSYHLFQHEDIAAQIRAHLHDPDADRRRLAIKLADDCAYEELREDLIAMLLDTNVDESDRVAIGRAVFSHREGFPTDELLPLLHDEHLRGDDPWDELKGLALLASSPHGISNKEVFSLLTPRKRTTHFGYYAWFLEEFRLVIAADDVAAGLEWLLKDLVSPARDIYIGALANRILQLAASSPDDPSVIEGFAQVVRTRLGSYEGLLFAGIHSADIGDLLANSAFRQAIASKLLEYDLSEMSLQRLASQGPYGLGLVRAEDLGWLIDQYASADFQLRSPLLSLVKWTFNPNSAEHRALIFNMSHDHPLYTDVAHEWVEAIPLDSLMATQMRTHSPAAQSFTTTTESQGDEINDEIEFLLDRFDDGDPTGFWRTSLALCFIPGLREASDELVADLTSSRRWSSLTESLRGRLINASENYLRSFPCQPEIWLEKPSIRFYPAEAGYRAMILLLKLRPQQLEQLPDDVWIEWAPVLACWRTFSDAAAWNDKATLFAFCGPSAIEAVRAAFLTRVCVTVAAGERPFLEREADYLWDQTVTDAYLNLTGEAREEPRAELVRALAKNDFESLRPLLVAWLGDESDGVRLRLAVKHLLDADFIGSWSHVKPVFDANIALAEEVLGDPFGSYRGWRVDQAAVPVAADFLLWLYGRFPPASDPQPDGAPMVDARGLVGHLRNSLLNQMAYLGTQDAVTAIRNIVTAFPEDRGLKHTLVVAEDALRTNEWTPTSLGQLLQLAADHHKVLVNNSATLRSTVIAVLENIQNRLTGATPRSHLLWDTHSHRPKSEDEISDYLSYELRDLLVDRGVIINREVQIRRNQPYGIGERIDLLINATSDHGGVSDLLSLPVEVKGAWNSELLSAIETQLVGRYMADLASSYGIYVVVWPDLDSWTDTSDGRQRDLQRLDREEVKSQLDAQVLALAEEGTSVKVVHLDMPYRRPT